MIPTKENKNLVGSFETEKLYLTIEGFYPKENPNIFYHISGIFNTAISLAQWILMLIFLAHQSDDLIKVSEVMLFCMTQSAFISKLANFIIKKNKMNLLEDHLLKPTLSMVDEKEAQLLDEYINGVKFLAKVFRLLCVGVVIFYGLFPLLDHSSGQTKKLPLPLWFPFEIEKSYYFIWFMIVLSISIGAWTNSNIDILTVMLVTVATAELEIIKNRLKNIVELNEDGTVKKDLLWKNLKKFVIHFNDIYSFVVDIERTFSNGIFVQFFCSVLVICLTCFQMLVISITSIQFILLIIYFNCMLCQIVMYCWYGHQLMESSDKLTEACYSTLWFECDAKTQKFFITVLERSKVPITLRAANFFTLNLATLMSILKSSYSFFAVLRHVYTNKISGNNLNAM